MAHGSTSAMALVDDIEGVGGFDEGDFVLDEGDFVLDLRVIEAAYPIAKLSCDTSDGCGSTCSGSACNSTANNPS